MIVRPSEHSFLFTGWFPGALGCILPMALGVGWTVAGWLKQRREGAE